MQTLLATVLSFPRQRIVVLGDVMLDRRVFGSVDRISPEAPIPVVTSTGETESLGGAANVAANIVRLGAHATLIGPIGADEAGGRLQAVAAAIAGLDCRLVRDPARPTTLKTRVIAQNQQMLRLDRESTRPADPHVAASLLSALEASLSGASALVCSDYAKGALTPQVLHHALSLAKERKLPVIVDPKHATLSRYRGATVITPNAREAALATGIACDSDEGAATAAREIARQTGCRFIVITRGAKGMTILDASAEGPALHVPATAREVFDVSGAGDTVLAMLALAMGAGLSIEPAARLANLAAGIVVGKAGTATVSASELVASLRAGDGRAAGGRIVTLDVAVALRTLWRDEGRRVVFTNGCFDILHPGHIHLLRSARAEGDVLIVGLNGDASVRRLKGDSRPIHDQDARSTVLAALAMVDLVVVFADDTPQHVIECLRPDVLVKGADYEIGQVVGAELVQATGGRVVLVPVKIGHSTSAALERLVAARLS